MFAKSWSVFTRLSKVGQVCLQASRTALSLQAGKRTLLTLNTNKTRESWQNLGLERAGHYRANLSIAEEDLNL